MLLYGPRFETTFSKLQAQTTYTVVAAIGDLPRNFAISCPVRRANFEPPTPGFLRGYEL